MLFGGEFSHCLEAWAYKAESSVEREKLPPKMVNGFGSTCVLLWRDFIYFIRRSLFFPLEAQRRHSRWSFSASWPIPFQLCSEITKAGPGNTFLFYFAIYSSFIIQFLLFQYVLASLFLLHSTLLSPSRDFFLCQLASQRRGQTNEAEKKSWQRRSSTHL